MIFLYKPYGFTYRFCLFELVSKIKSFYQLKKVSAEGLEPATNGLKGHCSTIELRARCGVHSIMQFSPSQRENLDFLGANDYYLFGVVDT